LVEGLFGASDRNSDSGTENSIYRWKAKYSGMNSSEAKRLKQLEEENRKLKHVVAELTLDNRALKDVLSKNW
jgi:putative transposase